MREKATNTIATKMSNFSMVSFLRTGRVTPPPGFFMGAERVYSLYSLYSLSSTPFSLRLLEYLGLRLIFLLMMNE